MTIPVLCQHPDACLHPECTCPVVDQAITAGASSPSVVFLMILRTQLEPDPNPRIRILLSSIDAEIARLRGRAA